jgi:hypothetical protein
VTYRLHLGRRDRRGNRLPLLGSQLPVVYRTGREATMRRYLRRRPGVARYLKMRYLRISFRRAGRERQ